MCTGLSVYLITGILEYQHTEYSKNLFSKLPSGSVLKTCLIMPEQPFNGYLFGTSDARLPQNPAGKAELRPVIRHNRQFDSRLSRFSAAAILPLFSFFTSCYSGIMVILPDENIIWLK